MALSRRLAPAVVLRLVGELDVVEELLDLFAGHLVEAVGGLVEVADGVEAGEDALQPVMISAWRTGPFSARPSGRRLLLLRLLQGGDEGGHLLAAEAARTPATCSSNCFSEEPSRRLYSKTRNHGLDAADEAVGLAWICFCFSFWSASSRSLAVRASGVMASSRPRTSKAAVENRAVMHRTPP